MVLLAGGLAVPVLLWWRGFPAWALGMLLGQIAGAISFVWVGLTVQRLFVAGTVFHHRKYVWQAVLRYLVVGGVFLLAVIWPAVDIWAVVVGYTMFQLPAAILRAIHG